MDNAPYRFTLIKAGRLIDGTGAPPIERGAVLFDNGKIAAAGPESEVAAPDGARVLTIEYPRMTVMPGMVDAHTHNNGFGDGRAGDDLATLPDEVLTVNSARNARLSLFTGVTTVRENGPKNTTMFRLRDAVEEGITVAPRLVLCGRAVSIIGGHMSYFGIQSTGPVEARSHVRQLIKEGADYIKITATGGSTRTSFPLRPSFDADELRAMTDEAHKFGKLTAAHCLSIQGIANSLDAGVDMIIHCVFKEPDDTDVFRYDIAERIGEQGTYVNPTLHVGRAVNWALEHKKADRGLTPAERKMLDEGYRSFDRRLEDCRRMIEMGLRVITGSDSSWGSYQLGNTPIRGRVPGDGGLLAHAGPSIRDARLGGLDWHGRPRWNAGAGEGGRRDRGRRQPGRGHQRAVECGGCLLRRTAGRPGLGAVQGRNPTAAAGRFHDGA